MKYTRKKLSVEVSDWRNNQSEYFRILSFVHEIFAEIGHTINIDIPVPVVKLTQFHWNTCRYRFDVDHPHIIYLNEKDYGKDMYAALIAALFAYYSNNLFPADPIKAEEIKMEALEDLEIKFTLGEVAFTSTAIVGGVLAAKTILGKLF